jgi:signal transduction histidine kinase
MSPILTFVYGAATTLSFIAAVVFVRFWKATTERLFVYFAVAFSILGADWIVHALGGLAKALSVRDPSRGIRVARLWHRRQEPATVIHGGACVKPHRDRAQRLGLVLAVSFGLTTCCFLGSRVISEYQARGIREDSETISLRTLPANDLLAEIGSNLRLIESAIDKLEDGGASQPTLDRVRATTRSAERRVGERWSSFRSLATVSGEQELALTTEANLRAMDAEMRVLLEGDRTKGSNIAESIDAARNAVRRVDEDIRAMSAFNRRIAVEAAERVERYRNTSRTWGIALDAASAMLALVTMYFVMRVVRRFRTLVEERMSELEYFAGRVAHDVRSPLATVSFVLELVGQRATLDPKVQAYAERGLRTLQRVGQLVDGLLAFAVAGRPTTGAGHADVKSVLDGIIDDAKLKADEGGIEIDYEPPDAKARMTCSPGVLTSIASNLLTNAIKYMGDSPKKQVAIRTRCVGGAMRVEVKDSGPGMPPPLVSRAFEPYVRGAVSTIPGFGLGLATVRRLVEVHGGSVGAVRNDDAGMLFWFELPCEIVGGASAASAGTR